MVVCQDAVTWVDVVVVLDVEEHAEVDDKVGEWVGTQLHSGRGREALGGKWAKKACAKTAGRRGWWAVNFSNGGRGRGAGTWVVGAW